MIRHPPSSTLFPHDALPICQADLNVQRVPGTIITVMFNYAMPPFDNLKVRQALNYAVNVDEIVQFVLAGAGTRLASATKPGDRKSTRLNSSHANISYAVFCL